MYAIDLLRKALTISYCDPLGEMVEFMEEVDEFLQQSKQCACIDSAIYLCDKCAEDAEIAIQVLASEAIKAGEDLHMGYRVTQARMAAALRAVRERSGQLPAS